MNDHDRDSLLEAAVRLRTDGHREEARQRLLSLAADFPADAEIAYQTAWAHDVLGLEAEAVPFYERCLAGTALSEEDRRGALLGLGSTYRVLGQYDKAVEVLREGAGRFPDDGALRTFLAMALFNTGEHHEAMRLLLELLAAGSTDPCVRQYRAAIEHYARDLNATL
ncbi:tetratricopeptide repeat protein [Streptomyces sp. JV185]|uniref:tetratricopeptide repeat protein n=1 Tax=Streptomyces sp. JV185 TaxID=858638 RepID=UPI002E777A07|nr:tetratricopeptide repeat protein [Streptomyces sp. JV185]MEE1770738.1 tetratricopeptide repeat protein [Streptomyces sp. JV185]